ncbi:hypothetical protein N7470_005619 [Penicillium chermesinum]|nr:hypothetical protein N7470_005619 [Penicillium chermesinum]
MVFFQACTLGWLTFGLSMAFSQNETPSVPGQLFNSLEESARLVDITYCVSTTGIQEPFQCLSHCAEFPDLELVTTWNTGILLSDSCGYIAVSHAPTKRIVVAFRGTYSITNTIIDLSAYPQSYVPYTGEEGKATERPTCANCTVHAGFMTSWNNTRSTVLPRIEAARQQYPDYELKGWNPTVTTFGEPMIGNGEFAKYLDDQFSLNAPDHADGSFRPPQFRRVTHVDDPVPLLPLSEWGYTPHSGEIFISKPELPPSIGDIQLCEGNQDPRCIAGSEAPSSLMEIYQDVSIPLSVFGDRLDPCSSSRQSKSGKTHQVVLSRLSSAREDVTCASDATTPLHPRSWNWSLIPARYRLWELFFAHRDYFWRIGLCWPGEIRPAKPFWVMFSCPFWYEDT